VFELQAAVKTEFKTFSAKSTKRIQFDL